MSQKLEKHQVLNKIHSLSCHNLI